MKRILFSLLALGMALVARGAQAQYSFEETVPACVKTRGRGTVNLSRERFKDGNASLAFSWMGQAELMVIDAPALSASMAHPRNGVMLWMCNDAPVQQQARFSIRNAAGAELCWFNVNLDFKGWRAVWVKYLDMHVGEGYYGDLPKESYPKDGVVLAVRPPATLPSGTLYIDRLSFTTTPINAQVTPDYQIPDNNHFLARKSMWQWCRLWWWESFPDFEDAGPLSPAQEADLALVKKHLDEFYDDEVPSSGNYDAVKFRPKLEKMYEALQLEKLPDGTLRGRPIVSNDEYEKGCDVKIQEAFNVLYRYALDYYFTKDAKALERFFLVGDHLLYQGFCWGSGMGTNHHYGYNIRGWSNALWMLRDEIRAAGRDVEYFRTLRYWSGLAECRLPYEEGRDEIIDTWNTLLLPKLTAALLESTPGRQYAAMSALAGWMSRSMSLTPGTIGGIKLDGTAFHHGGHYPAYATGAYSTLGTYLRLVLDTSFQPDAEARAALKKGLMAMLDYCNKYDWGMGIGGRHPFGGFIPPKVYDTYGFLAVMDNDAELGSAFLYLGGRNKDVNARLKKAGIKPVGPAEGFRVYNYGAFGITRRGGWMVTLKSYNTDVWASEIYARENRFGRYLSYGSVEIQNSGNPASADDSRLREPGWDWNRIPGTTTIHLPFEMLNSPNKGTLMERNVSRFPGASSLEGRNGCLAFTYVEKDRVNFCAGATATKSAFCFDNRIVMLGTNISNSSQYPTETTLFQNAMNDRSETLLLNDNVFGGFPRSWRASGGEIVAVEDLSGNCYVVPAGQPLCIEFKEQSSPDNMNKQVGKGDFVTAYLDHGVSPSGASYEYLILVEPTGAQIGKCTRKKPYEVIQADASAHVVRDIETGITAYISYKGYSGKGTAVSSIPAETIVMERPLKEGGRIVSVCCPDLGLSEKTYTTAQSSTSLHRVIEISGQKLEVDCIHGQPVEMTIK